MNSSTSDQPGLEPHWLGARLNVPARQQVFNTVQALTRARWRQIFADCAATAVLIALLASIIAVLAMRAGILDVPIAIVMPTLFVLCLGSAAVVAYLRRPDAMQTTIEADLKLNLKQRLSTAWEFLDHAERDSAHNDAALLDRLAIQAVKARLPARSRANLVFALQANNAALLIPVAIIVLIFVSVIDLSVSDEPTFNGSDEMVISEGLRLREYGQGMQARAEQQSLRQSTEQARNLRELGSRMQSGSLSKEEALSHLSDLSKELEGAQRDALNQGEQTPIGPLSTQTSNSAGQGGGLSPQALLQQLLNGNINLDDARSRSQQLANDPQTLANHGISSDELREALNQFAAGEQKKLEELLEKMSQSAQAQRDAQELAQARQRVDRARDSLGDAQAQQVSDSASAALPAQQAKQGQQNDANAAASDLNNELGDMGGSSSGRGIGAGDKTRKTSSTEARLNASAATLKAESKIGDGEVFVSQARVCYLAQAIWRLITHKSMCNTKHNSRQFCLINNTPCIIKKRSDAIF